MYSTIKTVVFWLVIVFSALVLWQVVKDGKNGQRIPEISYSEFLSQVESGNVSKVTIARNQITGRYQDNRSFRVIAPTSQEVMVQTLHQNKVEIWFTDAPAGDWTTWLMNLAPLILLAALWFFMIRQLRARRAQDKQP